MEHNFQANRLKIIAAFLLCILALFLLLIVTNINSSGIEFKDANLEKVIREKLDKPNIPITHASLLTITDLDASNRGITSLEGIEYLNKLVTLNLEGNQIKDVSPLSTLEMLSYINLENNRISDLSKIHFDKLADLPLTEINLSNNVDENGNQLSDIQILSGFHDLQIIDLRGNNISNITALSSIPTLVEINLRDNNVQDISELENLSNLEYLNLHTNPVKKGINSLGKLTHLKTLVLTNVYIGENITFLERLDELEKLNLRNTSITDITVVANLMKNGALQDNSNKKIHALVNLLDNPIGDETDETDPYFELRKYWNNISIRYPINLPYVKTDTQEPVFSHESGFYQTPFSLILSTPQSDATIYYTLDGSEPGINVNNQLIGNTLQYTQPILIEPISSNGNKHSTTNSLTVETQKKEIINGMVVRVVSVSPDGIQSKIISKTYFIDQSPDAHFSLPIISLAINPEYLFDDEVGLFSEGNSENLSSPEEVIQNANYYQKGLQWERPAAIELINSNNQDLLSQNIGLRVHGGFSRMLDNKSLRLIASNVYDESDLFHFNFPTSQIQSPELNTYQTLILRNSGNDNNGTFFRDVLAQSLLASTDLDIQYSQPVNVFINGQYWGIYNLRTRFDEHYFYSRHSVNVNDLLLITYIDGWPYVEYGNEYDYQNHYMHLFELIDPSFDQNNYVTKTTLSNQSDYQNIANLININNTCEYFAAEIYFNNIDWPRNNVRLWAKSTQTGQVENPIYSDDEKLHWMISDIDMGFGNPNSNTLQRITTGELQNDPSTYLFRSLLTNDEFKITLINRIATQLNTIFREEVVLSKIDTYQNVYEADMQYHIDTWDTEISSIEIWRQNIGDLRNFATLRPSILRKQVISQYDLPGSATITFKSDSSTGYIRINDTDITAGTIGVGDPDQWIGIYFQGIPINLYANPQDGYIFDHWESSLASLNNLSDANLSVIPTGDFEISAVFKPD